MRFLAFLTILSLSFSGAFASDVGVVNSKTCAKLSSPKEPFILLLNMDEKLPDALIECADAAGIKSASISGLGLLKDPTIAYYDLSKKAFKKNPLKGLYELSSINGNLTQLDGKTTTHLHLNLADKNNKVVGGHFIEGLVGVVAELTITPLPQINKKHDDKLNLNVMIVEEN